MFDQVTQDSDAVLSILEDILVKIKTRNPLIQDACIRSDNAGCYHSAQTILSLPQLSASTNIKIRRFDFSDPQGGKGSCVTFFPNYCYCFDVGSSDRYAAVLKSHVRRYLNEGHDVSTANQFVAACESYGGVRNVHVFECQLASARSKCKAKINEITKLHNFIYGTNSIRSYRAWDIGVGKIITLNENGNVPSKVNSLVCVNTSSSINRLVNSSVNDRSIDVVSSVTKDLNTNNEPKSRNKLFYCDYEGCICRFLNYGNLLRHITNGNHDKRVEKLPMKDLAMITYKSKLDTVDNQELLSLELDRISLSQTDYTNIPLLNKGWALPLPRKVQRLTPKVRQFLKEKFDDGEINGIRWQPEAVVHEIKYSKDSESGLYVFDISELVKVSTVRSFFSRQKATKVKKNDSKASSTEDNIGPSGEEYDEEENNEEEEFQEQLANDLELQFDDIRTNVIQRNTAENHSTTGENSIVTATSKRALSSLENDNFSHIRKSSRFPRKKD